MGATYAPDTRAVLILLICGIAGTVALLHLWQQHSPSTQLWHATRPWIQSSSNPREQDSQSQHQQQHHSDTNVADKSWRSAILLQQGVSNTTQQHLAGWSAAALLQRLNTTMDTLLHSTLLQRLSNTTLEPLWGDLPFSPLEQSVSMAAGVAAAADPLCNNSSSSNSSSSLLDASSAEFTEGYCCAGAIVKSNRSKEAVCRFHRSRDLLVGKPSGRPDKFGTTCLAYAHDIAQPAVQPQYSVLLNVWNTGLKLRVVLTQLIKLTRGPWELIVLFDACEDNSYQVAMELLDRVQSWPQCTYSISSVDQAAVWTQRGNWSHPQNDIGRECWFERPSLVSVRFINNTKVGLQNTAGDNIKMLASRAPFLILVDDDQFMTVEGWNIKAAYPLQRWPDVISTSMRCAHGFPNMTGLVGAKCVDTLAKQYTSPAKCMFYVKDSGNRGPLVLRAEYVKQLGYLNEARYLGAYLEGE